MNIKQKLTWAFAVIACLPVVLVATLVVMNLRSDAKDNFVDGSGREIRQVSNAMQLFFDGISQNVNYLASQPLIKNTDASLKTYMSANATEIPQGEMDKQVFALLQDLGASHPSYAYAIIGTSAGGYVSWPDDRNWPITTRASVPGTKRHKPNRANRFAPRLITGLRMMRLTSVPCAPSTTSSAPMVAWSAST